MSHRALGPQFEFTPANDENDFHALRVHRSDQPDGFTPAGHMVWSPTGEVEQIRVREDMRRRGVATELWHEAQRVSREHGVSAPRHSPQRTTAGDAWARTVGGELPQLARPSMSEVVARSRGDGINPLTGRPYRS